MKFLKTTLTALFVICSLLMTNLHAFEIQSETKSYDTSLLFQSLEMKAVHHRPVEDQGKPLLVMVHCSTYGKWIWDVPGISWKEYFVGEKGYPMVAVDLIGYGESSRPHGGLLTPINTAIALARVMPKITSEYPDREIVYMGVCLGGMLGNFLAANDAISMDGFVNIGWLHPETEYNAQSFSFLQLEDYFSFPPEARTAKFYYPEGADQQVMDYDTAHQYPMARGNMWAMLYSDLITMDRVDIPVFLTCGDRDFLIQDGYTLEDEANLYVNAPSVTTWLQPDAGHISMLHTSGHLLMDRIDQWMEEMF